VKRHERSEAEARHEDTLLKGTVYEPGAERRELMACAATAALLEGVVWPSRRETNVGPPS